MERREVISCRDVYDELQEQSDELAEWAKQRKSCFHEPTEQNNLELSEFMATNPHYVASGGPRNKADPLVIIQSRSAGATIVTYEEYQVTPPKKASRPPHIPNVCEDMEIPWVPPWTFLELSGIRF